MGMPTADSSSAALPIAGYKHKILATITKNQVTIIKGDTGSGKSTQVPQYLLEAGYEVVVTQPRRLAARTLAERVASEYGCRLGDVIGFKTAFENQRSRATKCLFVTDGLALIRELIGARKPGTILVIDEVHEWNINIEVLIGYIKHLLKTDSELKVVLMSATMEVERLSEHFGHSPVVEIPGRLFPIEDRASSGDIISDTIRLLREEKNVLVFQPGKREIEEMMFQLRECGVHAEILPLHAELTPAEQARCFAKYHRPKCVIATNVAQTSITIPDINAVIDSGMERRKELKYGVEGLYLKPISLADSKQRRGRGGRCGPGIYIDCCPDSNRLEFPQAEILRSLLDQTVLRLAGQGYDAEKLEFFHQPDIQEIRTAKQSLRLIGCMDEHGQVTEIGSLVAKLPVEVKFGRMLVEAQKLGVLSDVLTIVAILEVGGIIDHKSLAWRGLCQNERDSDVLAQLVIYKKCHQQEFQWLRRNGIHVKSLNKARENRAHIIELLPEDVVLESTGNRRDIIKAIMAGFIGNLFVNRFGYFKPVEFGKAEKVIDSASRMVNKDSVVPNFHRIVAGIPFDLNTTRGTLYLLNMVTVIDVEILKEVAPQAIREEKGVNARYDYVGGCVVSDTKVYLGTHEIQTITQPDPEHPDTDRILEEMSRAALPVARRLPYNSSRLAFLERDRRLIRAHRDLQPVPGERIYVQKPMPNVPTHDKPVILKKGTLTSLDQL